MAPKKTILIAEPSGVLASELESFMSEMSFHIIRVDTLKATLLALQSRAVDVLLLDADLLQGDCGFVSIIKGMEADLPVIICAATNTQEFESRIRKQRIFFYHIKSFGIQDLEMAISNAANRPPRQ